MDLLKLHGQDGEVPYKIDGPVITGYISLIWTERYSSHGEFVLTTKLAAEFRELLPIGTLVSHRETKVIMMVETHTIREDERGFPLLEIKGQEATVILEHRHIEGRYQKKRPMRRKYSVSEAAGVLVWNAVANPSTRDVTREGDYAINAKDLIPNAMVAISVYPRDLNPKGRQLSEGPAYPQIRAILDLDDLGIRAVRPPVLLPKLHVDYIGTGVGNYYVLRQVYNFEMAFEIYQGVDRSVGSPDVFIDDMVSFRWDEGHVESPEHVWSNQNQKTAMEIMSAKGGADQYASGAAALTGFSRRVGSIDAGTPDYPDEPTNKTDANMNAWRAEKEAIDVEFMEDIKDEARRELRRARRMAVFSASVTADHPWKYNKDYFLGDKVTLVGEYLTEKMIVAEYVRTDDDEGDRGFPGLVVP